MSKPLRALIVEDSEDDTLLLLNELKRGGYAPISERVETPEAMITALRNQSWDIILSDYSMPHFSAPEALKIFHQSGLDLPFIVISGTVGEDVAVSAMKSGAHDYLMKGNLSRLCPAIEREIREAEIRKKSNLYEKSLEESEKQYRLLADNTLDCIWLTDLELNFKYVNPAIFDMLGFTQDEWIGSNLSDHCYPEDLEDVLRVTMAELKKGIESTGITFETRLLHENGEIVHVEITCRIWFDNDGYPEEFQGVTRCISERRLLEDQLRQSQKMEAIGSLAGGVAHDFNNILQAIFGYSDLALSCLSKDDPEFEYLKEIRGSAERAADLTRQLLAFGRRQILIPRDINLNDLINELIKLLERLISEDIILKFVPENTPGTVHADPGQIEQVIINLCVNARDAMPEGGNLTIETENVLLTEDYCSKYPWAMQGHYMLLTVTDTGSGMDEDTCKLIFEPFFTTKSIGKGTGLGLSTAYGIVNQHNGFIHVYSEEGIGTAFKVYLPIVDRPAEHITAKVDEKAVGGTETILVAEDDKSVRKIVGRILEAAGYSVFMAEDGLQAIQIFKQHSDSISLVLLDVVMPEMNGIEVHDRIKELAPNTKFLFTSGYSSNAIHTSFILNKGMHFISKPYDPNTLLHRIKAALKS